MTSSFHLALISAELAFGILGTFYLSAQALGFENLRVLHLRLLAIIDAVVAVHYIQFTVDEATNTVKAPTFLRKINQMLLAGQVIRATLLTSFRIWRIIIIDILINFLIIHGILGLVLAGLWVIIAFQFVIPIPFSIPIPLWGKIVVAVAIYLGGSNLFGEKPHEAVLRLCRKPAVLLDRHINWIEDNTKSGGKTGIIGFLMICAAFMCDFATEFI